jgi:anaerobic selenocysteine-containing dehydrogenase
MQVEVVDGVATKVSGDPAHSFTAGTLCAKVSRYPERTYHAERLKVPLKRVGKKGEGRFEPVSWDAALSDIALRLHTIAARDPQAILPYSYAGTMGYVQGDGMSERFFNRLGASKLDRTICSSAGVAGLNYTLGGAVGMDVEQFEHSKLILIWGSNSVTSNLHFWRLAQEAKRKGAKLIAIDPYASDTALKCHEHIALKPGTDAALALGLMHELIVHDWLDHDYIEQYTLGFAELRARALAYPPEVVAKICGLTSLQVKDLARDYAQIKSAAIRLNYGLQRVRGGANSVRAIVSLPALIGAWRDPAGGALLSASGFFPTDEQARQRPDLRASVQASRVINMSAIGDALAIPHDQTPIEAVIVYNSNPVAVAPDSEKVIAGFSREDLFCVVLEHFQTDTADYADYLLPATTQLEHFDLHKAYGHQYVMVNHPAIKPVGEARSNSSVFRELAQRLGFDEPCFKESDEALGRSSLNWSHPNLQGVSWEQVMTNGWARLKVSAAPFAHGGWPTPSGKVEFFSERLAATGFDPLPQYLPPYESEAHAPDLFARFPLQLISPPARNFLNSSFVNIESLRKSTDAPSLEIHPVDAAARGIVNGMTVELVNDRGACSVRANVSERTREGVLVAWGIWWHKLCQASAEHGPRNVNALTSQALTDHGRGATFYDCLVEVRTIDLKIDD